MVHNSQVLIREENKDIQQNEHLNFEANPLQVPEGFLNQNIKHSRKPKDSMDRQTNLNSHTNQRLKKWHKPFYMSEDDCSC